MSAPRTQPGRTVSTVPGSRKPPFRSGLSPGTRCLEHVPKEIVTTASPNRPTVTEPVTGAAEATGTQYGRYEPGASLRRKGTYIDRYDRPHPAPRPEGSYVSGARDTSARGSYTWVEGAPRRADRPEGCYTLCD